MSDAPPPADWLQELNDAQRAAVTHGDGPLLIVAGAGSGKTKTLACRVAWLISQGVNPERILLLTFTRRAAEEMLRRAAQAVGGAGAAGAHRVWGGTFHAIANRLLRMYAQPAGMAPDFTVMDQSDAEDLMDVVRHEQKLSARDKRFPRKGTCLDIYSRCVNGAEDLPQALARHFPWCAAWEADLRTLFKAYVERKQEQNVLDYDDLLLYWRELLADDALAERIGGRFDHILVDEYQDTNRVQADILRRMRLRRTNLTVVGDDAQSIYSFRAASIRNMLDFPQQFPGTRIVTLEQNFRSVAPILDSTNRLIAQAKERFSKTLWSARSGGARPALVSCRDENEQDAFVVQRILEHYEQGIPLKKMAVLFRTAYHSDSLELELTRRNIPYHKYGGLKFIEAAHVKDLIAFLRILENPRDRVAWFRVLQLLDGVGPGTAEKIIHHVAQRGYDLRALGNFPAQAAYADGLQAFAQLLDDLAGRAETIPAAQVERIRRFYEPIFRRSYDNAKVRLHDLESLERVAGGYASRADFLTDLTLDPPSATSDLAGPPVKDEDWMTLSTIHSAKGCEWDVVFVIHVADGCLPSDMATGTPGEIEEELRLLYVAMTRARDFLYVVWPLRYYAKWRGPTDRHTYAQRSRFLTDAVCGSMEAVRFGTHAADAPATGGVLSDLQARVKARWG
jgi:DNA helicase-2/ATP-dependent DNA helicase PcrA